MFVQNCLRQAATDECIASRRAMVLLLLNLRQKWTFSHTFRINGPLPQQTGRTQYPTQLDQPVQLVRLPACLHFMTTNYIGT